MPHSDTYAALIGRLDRFTRKYYLNQVIRGALYTAGLVGVCFLAAALLEGSFYFDRAGRKVLFYSFLAVTAAAVLGWVALPLARYFRLGPVISHDKAAAIIGAHFPDVQDKLLNLLQLGRDARAAAAEAHAAAGVSHDLVLASIDQKSAELQPVPFRRAIDLSQNRKYLRYALPPLLLLIAFLFAAPSLITDSTTRLVRNDEDFERPAPFRFVLPEGELSVIQFEDYPLVVEATGAVTPAEVYVDIDGSQYRLRPVGQGRFAYDFQQVADDLDFRLVSGEVSSVTHTLAVIKKPNLLGFTVQLDYPAHTGRRDETVDNLGDLTVPEGTRLRWVFEADHTEALELRFGESRTDTASREGRQIFQVERRIRRSTPYTVITGNAQLPRADSVRYAITAVQDALPSISARSFTDSTQRGVVFWAGEAADDYGLSALRLVYTRTPPRGAPTTQTIDLGRPAGKSATFDYTFDLDALRLAPGEELVYYFETLDNDGVNGAKAARTPTQSYRKKSLEEYEAARAEQSEDIKEKLRETAKESKKLQEEMKRLREQLLQKKEMDWQTRQELERLMERQAELQQKIEEAKQEFEEAREEEAEFEDPDAAREEEQAALEEMFEELQDPELQEMMEKIKELMDKLEKDEALDMMQEMQESEQQTEQKLDRLEELFKKLELEYEQQTAAEELERLADEQEKLGEETSRKEDGEENAEQRAKQDQLNEAFEKLEEKLDGIDEKNQALERPMEDTGTDPQQQEGVKQDQQQAGEKMQQQQNQQAGQQQKQAAQKMRQMAQKMQQAMQSGQQQQAQEDIKAIRQLLENLVTISYDQEGLLEAFAKTEINTPRYVEEVQQQFKLKDDFRIVDDSLQALAKRVTQIETFVLEKVGDVRSQMDRALDDLEQRQVGQAANRQQRIMTDVNDLALMLSESMDQMQQQMASAMPGQQACEKPGGKGQGQGGKDSGKSPSDKMSQGQQSLKEQMERAMENMQKQAQGQQQGKGQGGVSSKEFAEMAAKQAALRKQLRDKQRQLLEQGKGSKGLQDIIEGMDKVETDLVNKRLTNEMLKRQEEILTKLLEAEKADRQQDEEERREAERAKEIARVPPPALEEYLRQRNRQTDLYREVSPDLRPYYRRLVEQYQDALKGQ